MKIKKLCDLSRKDIEKQIDDLIRILTPPKFICVRCCRCAGNKQHLCKPQKLEGTENK